MYKAIFSVLFLFTCATFANEKEVLTVDRIISHNIELAFDNDTNEKPKLSEFQLVNYIVMSNDLGERWAVVTIKNQASGNRILENDHLMALFANGKRSNPAHLKINFDANETKSLTISFGENKFPLLSISVSS
ncbi:MULTISPECIES: hypothetical protein [unclassified Pseudoalteromonas]|uniref:hypothetical protein n=1 Tax=unclassified Pseudoalteromonas TaxID=194690 RepID=UPI0005A99B5D|nr:MULTISPECIES: hypothetical protein [unclassified Pseudoalteromonas]